MGISLPWDKPAILKQKPLVQQFKEEFMKNTHASLTKLFTGSVPGGIKSLMKYISTLSFNVTPNYHQCRNFLERDLRSLGNQNAGVLEFSDIRDLAANQPIAHLRQLRFLLTHMKSQCSIK